MINPNEVQWDAIDPKKVKWDSSVPTPDAIGPFEAAMIGAGKTTTRIGQGIKQGWYGLTGNDKSATDLAAQVAEENRLYAPLAKARPIATGLGEALPAMAIPVGSAGGFLAGAGRAALANAIPGALEYGTVAERAKSAGIGAAGGAVGAGIGYGLGRAINPFRGANPLATNETRVIADAAGLSLTPAQATGSKVLSSLDGTLATFPGSASAMAKIQQAQREGFNRAATGMIGEVPVSSITNDAASIASKNLGAKFNSLPSGVTVPISDSVVDDLARVETKYMRRLGPDVKPVVKSYIDDILSHSDTGMPGDLYQAARSDLGAHAASLREGSPEALAYKGIQKALDKAFTEAAPPDIASQLAKTREQYRNFKTLKPLLEKAAMTSSNIPPMQVMSRALATDNTRGPMQNLAQLGQAIGGDYPNSGTAPRMFWQSILENPLRALNPMMSVGAPAAWTTAHAIHSPPGRAWLTNKLVSPEIESLLTGYGGLLGAGGTRGLLPQ